MDVSPLAFFPLLYLVLAAAMGAGATVRWRRGLIHLWQLLLTLALKLVPIVAFAYAYYYGRATDDAVGAYFMYAIAAVVATVIGFAWVGFDLLGLGVWRRDEAGPPSAEQPVRARARAGGSKRSGR